MPGNPGQGPEKLLFVQIRDKLPRIIRPGLSQSVAANHLDHDLRSLIVFQIHFKPG
jgi:hypothetical protein